MTRRRSAIPRPPAHLSPRSGAFWRHLTGTFVLEPHHLELLRLACEHIDRGEQAREAVAREGLTIRDRWQQIRPHPGIAIERNAALVVGRLVRQLGLDQELPSLLTRPPR